MADLLDGFLREVAGQRFRWGRTDCVSVVFRWIAVQTGRDPSGLVAAWRDWPSAHRLIAARGGMLQSSEVLMAAIGLPRARLAVRGDIGIVEAVRGVERIAPAAICVGGGRWAYASEGSGLCIVKASPLAAWALA